MTNIYDIKTILETLKQHSLAPLNIEKTKYNTIYFYNCYDNIRSDIVTYGVTTGISKDENTAFIKALIEWVERKAFFEGVKNKLPSCQTVNSDGFAAFPIIENCEVGFAQMCARENALNEAIERYVWATWWDRLTGAHIEIKHEINFQPSCDLLEIIENHTSIKQLFRIEPLVSNFEDRTTIIFFLELQSGGYISGGATGKKNEIENIEFRALSEMMRHSVGLSRALSKKLAPKTLYESRLLHFGSGFGSEKIKERLAGASVESITLPSLLYDEQIPHALSSSVVVHRCLFHNQPPFIGGDLDRLCL